MKKKNEPHLLFRSRKTGRLKKKKRKIRLVRNLTKVNVKKSTPSSTVLKNTAETQWEKKLKKKVTRKLLSPIFLPLAKNVMNHMTNQQKFCQKVITYYA